MCKLIILIQNQTKKRTRLSTLFCTKIRLKSVHYNVRNSVQDYVQNHVQ